MEPTLADQQRLIDTLTRTGLEGNDAPEVIETHISWLILAGGHAYKFKKNLDLGFLDYSSLAKRRTCCEQELRLNRRTAPELYQAVVAIGGTPETPQVGVAPEHAIEFAVRMRRFPAHSLLSERLATGAVDASVIDALAQTVAEFHHRIERAGPDSPYGTPDQVNAPVEQNFVQIAERIEDGEALAGMKRVRTWSRDRFEQLQGLMRARRGGGFIRECHGDLHLGNIVQLDHRPVPFDCIEFNANLRWIDVISEVAFLTMDLIDRGRDDYAARTLNRYLELTGDYAGVTLLRYYQSYRAMVRAKVAAIRLQQPTLSAQEQYRVAEELHGYLALAQRFTEPQRPFLALTYGFSGSGKTTYAAGVVERFSAIRIRSDVERKRLHGLAPLAASDSAPGGGIYTAAATARTYGHLCELAGALLDAGFPVVVDAAFLHAEQRRPFLELAQARGLPAMILEFHAQETTLRQRLQSRTGDASEADVDILERQLSTRQPLTDAEQVLRVLVDTESADALERLHRGIEAHRAG